MQGVKAKVVKKLISVELARGEECLPRFNSLALECILSNQVLAKIALAKVK